MPRSKFPKERQDALLAWARRMIEDDKRMSGPERIEDLYDGAVFSDLLETLDEMYNPSELQENLAIARSGEQVEGRRRNLHIIHLALRSFVRRECEGVETLIKEINFQALDKEPNNEGMCQILTAFLLASVNLEQNTVSQQILQDFGKSPTGTGTIRQLMHVMQEAQDKIKSPETIDDQSATITMNADEELAREAELARLYRDNDHLLRQNADYKTLHDRLKESHDDLLEAHEQLQNERDALEKQLESGTMGSGQLAETKKRLRETETVVDNLELHLEDARQKLELLEEQNRRLTADKERLQPLFDENHYLKQENEQLSKKANTAEHLKQKLEKLRGLEIEVKTLREDKNKLLETHENMQIFEKKLQQANLEHEEYIRKMQVYEIHEAEFQDQKMMWTMENQKLRRHIDELETKLRHDEEVVRDLQERVLMLDPSASPTDAALSPRAQHLSLEDELNDTSNELSMKDLEVSRLQAENILLKSSIGTETDKGLLLQQLEKERDARMELQQKYNDLFERHTVDKATLDSLIENMNGEGNEAYSNLRRQILAEENRSKQLQRRIDPMEAELKDKERLLLEIRGDINAISREANDQLSVLKETDGMLAVSLRAELDGLRRKNETLKSEFDSRQEQLVSALIDKDQLRKDLEVANAELQKAVEGQSVNPDVVKMTEKMEKLRARYKKLSEQFEKSEQARYEAERSLKSLRTGTAEGQQKGQQDHVIKNLQRENAMIATAWYDLSSRLQSNHVVLQRRNDVPRSWLNKQRQMVNGDRDFGRNDTQPFVSLRS